MFCNLCVGFAFGYHKYFFNCADICCQHIFVVVFVVVAFGKRSSWVSICWPFLGVSVCSVRVVSSVWVRDVCVSELLFVFGLCYSNALMVYIHLCISL